MICEVCGCTDERACVDPETGERCHWPLGIDPADPVCSFCLEAAVEGSRRMERLFGGTDAEDDPRRAE
jgi:hypothetical protein